MRQIRIQKPRQRAQRARRRLLDLRTPSGKPLPF